MFGEYKDKLMKLDLEIDENKICSKDFELYNDNNLSIYYAPHNEYINLDAKVIIVGITPGFSQTQIAYETANKLLKEKMPDEDILKECKYAARFAGVMRKNIIQMLNELELYKYLNIDNCDKLFERDNTLLHTTSLIPYPTFVKGKNYTGHNPDLLKNNILMNYIENYFYSEISKLSKPLIIPLGTAVEEVLIYMSDKNIIDQEQILLGFPHPSGANAHRKEHFLENKSFMIQILKDYFKGGIS